jgi:hypothetical protein
MREKVSASSNQAMSEFGQQPVVSRPLPFCYQFCLFTLSECVKLCQKVEFNYPNSLKKMVFFYTFLI